MTNVRKLPKNFIGVRRPSGGWCATYKKTIRYSDSIHTVCGVWINLPWEIDNVEPDCPRCCKRLGLDRAEGR